MKKAFDFSYHSVDGDKKQLSAKVQEADKTVLYFSRYMGCPFCQVDMVELCEEYPRLREKNVQLLLVLQSAPETVRNQTLIKDFPFEVVCDPEGTLYRLYGVKTASSMLKMINPLDRKLWKKIRSLLKHKLKHGAYEGNEQQLPALFLLNHNMDLFYSHYAKSISDMPDIDNILKLL